VAEVVVVAEEEVVVVEVDEEEAEVVVEGVVEVDQEEVVEVQEVGNSMHGILSLRHMDSITKIRTIRFRFGKIHPHIGTYVRCACTYEGLDAIVYAFSIVLVLLKPLTIAYFQHCKPSNLSACQF
jgi:hypothetical protein